MTAPSTASELASSIDALRGVIAGFQAADPAAGQLPEGAKIRELFTALRRTTIELRTELSLSEDPRLALELAFQAQQLGCEATRMELAAAERLRATAAHTLAHEQLDSLRDAGPDLSSEPARASGRPSYKTPADLLVGFTGCTFNQANRALKDAQDLIGRSGMDGSPRPPRFTHLAAQFMDPDYNPQTVRAVSAKLAKAEPKDKTFEGTATWPTLMHEDGRSIEEHAAAVIEASFTGAAALKETTQLINKAVEQQKNDQDKPPKIRRGLYPLPVTSPYERRFLLCVSALEGAMIDSFRANASNPRTQAGQEARKNPASAKSSSQQPSADDSRFAGDGTGSITDLLPEGGENMRWEDDEEFVDEASPPERALNALLDLLNYEYFNEDEDNPPSTDAKRRRRRVRSQLVVHMEVQDLRNIAAASAHTADGTWLPPGMLRRMLCDAQVIPAVFNSQGTLLDYGRAVRLVPEALQKAVLARDRGCIVPGCTAKIEHLQFHHIQPFSEGGSTSASNTIPGCATHHMEMDLGIIKIVCTQGLPWVLLPKDRDPKQLLRRGYSPRGLPTSIQPPDATC